MSITLDENSNYFSNYSGIRYITGWDSAFKPNNFSGKLLFYPGFPKKLVNVYHTGLKKTLKEEEIHVMIGKHNSENIDEDVNRNRDTIYEMCKMPNGPREFVLNLATMKIVERADFVDFLPNRGLNTLFVFENIDNGNFYCLANPFREMEQNPIPDIAFYTWLVSYVYSQNCCLSTDQQDIKYGKQFMQALSTLACGVSKKGSIYISKDQNVLNCAIGDIGERDIVIPGNGTDRFMDLVAKAWYEKFPSTKDTKKL